LPKFRKKPVIVEARQLTEDNHEAIARWCHGRHRGVLLPSADQTVQIDTLEGEMSALVGDWIIRGVQGEFYPCRDDIFRATYEPVED
jgi:hypothetical protein